MVTTLNEETKCVQCKQVVGCHTHDGSFCPVFGSDGFICSFSPTARFKAELEWKPGDTYTRLDYDTLVVVGVIREVRPGSLYAKSIELVADSHGEFIETGHKTVEISKIVRMVPA